MHCGFVALVLIDMLVFPMRDENSTKLITANVPKEKKVKRLLIQILSVFIFS
jgi:hypothetical protein